MAFYRSERWFWPRSWDGSRAWRLPLLLGLALSAGGACSGPTGPGVRLRLAGSPLPQTGCLQPSSSQPVDATALLKSGSIRIAAVQRASNSQHLLCEASATVPSESLNLDLGEGDRAAIDLYAEFFDPSGSRVASGSLLATALDGTSSTPPTLHLFTASGWSCPPSRLSRARAFHSATILPSGEVLLLGGIEALDGFGSDVFGLVDSAEIYAPRQAAFVSLTTAAGTLSGRAFHSIAVLGESDGKTRLVVYGGVTAPPGQPALFVPDSPTQLRLMPGGVAQPGAAQILDYDPVQRTLSVSEIDVGSHRTALAGGAALPSGGLVIVGGASFNQTQPFSRANPASLTPVTESATFFLRKEDAVTPPAAAFAAGGSGAPWLLGASVTPLSTSTALVLGAKLPPDAGIQMQALSLSGLPASVSLPGAQAVAGPATVFHTATRLGSPIAAVPSGSATQVLVTGGFVQDPQPPNSTRQPPAVGEAVRLYTVSDSGQNLSSLGYRAITPYLPSGTCGAADGHYRPAGFEAATATLSGGEVLITGGTPTVPSSGCADCELTDSATSKLLCVLTQSSIYDAATQTLSAAPPLSLGRMGHQETRLLDGNILVTGGLVRPGGTTQATAESEVYNPLHPSSGSTDPNDPLAALRKSGTAPSCTRL